VVIVAFLALLLSSLLAIAVAVTLVAALTLIPAVVTLLGTRVFWPSKAWQREPKGARFAAIGSSLGKRPAVFAGVSGLVLVALAIGALGFKPTFDLSSGIPGTAESQVALTVLERGLPPGATEPTQVYLHTTSGTLTAEEIAGYGTKLKTMDAVGAVAPATVSTDQATAEYTVTLSVDPESTTAVNTVKNGLRPQAHAAAPPGTYALVGGTTAMFFSPSLTALVGNRAWWPGHQGDRR
jgi:putative drug exporter of the RND superfamily